MTAFDLVRVNFFCRLVATIGAVAQVSITYTEPQKDQVPVAGVTQLSTIDANSAIKCSQRCLSNGEKNSSCDGVIYQARSCAGNNGRPTDIGGVCQLVQRSSTQSLAFAPTNSSCKKFYSPRVYCAVELQSFSFTTGPSACTGSTFNLQSGFVKLNGNIVASINWCDASAHGYIVRGVTLITIDAISCSVIKSKLYNTGAYASDSTTLANDLQAANNGTFFVAITGDDPQANLSPAFSALSTTCNVNVRSLVFRGSFAFVCKIGFPTMTKWQMAASQLPFAQVDATVSGNLLGGSPVIL